MAHENSVNTGYAPRASTVLYVVLLALPLLSGCTIAAQINKVLSDTYTALAQIGLGVIVIGAVVAGLRTAISQAVGSARAAGEIGEQLLGLGASLLTILLAATVVQESINALGGLFQRSLPAL